MFSGFCILNTAIYMNFKSLEVIRFIFTLLAIGLAVKPATAQVVINEVMHYPSTAQGIVATGTEYVELFNTNPCQAVDISCYILGCADNDGSIVNNAGSIVIPFGTVIPPYGHFVIGTSSSSANPASVDFKTNNNTGNYCTVGNFVLANGDGWVALYNASGIPVDALYWTVSAGEANKISTDTDFDDNPCTPPTVASCGTISASLPSAKQIFLNYPSAISYIGQYVNANTISRIPDGGTWTRTIAPSINDATVGNCNGGTCLTPSGITFTASKVNPTCAGNNGSITINVTSAGTTTYSWSVNANTGNTGNATNLNAGTYSVTITQNGCTKDTSITLTAPSNLTLTISNPVNPTCAGNDGSLTVTLSGGSGPYTITVDTGSSSFNFTSPVAGQINQVNLPAGAISISVVDGSGCTANASATLTAPANCCSLSLSAAVAQPTCGQSNGSITVTPQSGSGNYSYNWAGGQSTNAVTGVAAGIYQLTLTDNSTANCFIDTSFTLNSNSSLTVAISNVVNPTCTGNNGSLTVTLSGGSGPYTITVDTGSASYNITSPIAGQVNQGNLPAGTISVSVVDGGGCTASVSATLTAPANCCTFTISANTTLPGCGTANGSISLTVSNGSGNYTYNWSNGQSTSSLSALQAGTYPVTITDNAFAGCTRDTSFTLSNPNSPTINTLNLVQETCQGTSDGSITIVASGGSGSLSYQWSANAATGNLATAANLTAGQYYFTVTDIANCQTSGTATIQSGICCNLQIAVTATPTNCGLNNGAISVQATNGNTPYNYALKPGPLQTDSFFNQLPAGSYEVLVVDNNGCADSASVTVAASTNTLAITFATTDVSCNGGADGTIVSNVTGGSPLYNYLWSNGSTNSTISAVSAGQYIVSVTDNDGCSVTGTAVVSQPAPLVVTLGNDTTICTGNQISLQGPAGYQTYSWSTGETGSQIQTNTTGLYILTVTDNNNCSASASVNINVAIPVKPDIGSDISITEGESTLLSATNISGANGTYLWSPAQTLSCSNCNAPVATPATNTIYTLLYADANNCTVSDTILVSVAPVGNIFFPTAFSPNGDGNNDIYRVLGSSPKFFRLKIFNRWGEQVFESNNINDGWDGIYKGLPQPMAVYVYSCTVTLQNNQTRDYKGSITLL